MPNYFDGIVNQFLKDQFNNGINEVIRAFEVPSTIYYPTTRWDVCTNCATSLAANSPNPYLKGKQTPSCSVCDGSGKIAVESSEAVNLAIIFNYKKFQEIAGIALVVKGDAQTLCNMSLATKIKTAKYVTFDSNREYYNSHKFQRMGEPVPLGIGDNQFLLTTWETVA